MYSIASESTDAVSVCHIIQYMIKMAREKEIERGKKESSSAFMKNVK